jgi:hypothetical protein
MASTSANPNPPRNTSPTPLFTSQHQSQPPSLHNSRSNSPQGSQRGSAQGRYFSHSTGRGYDIPTLEDELQAYRAFDHHQQQWSDSHCLSDVEIHIIEAYHESSKLREKLSGCLQPRDFEPGNSLELDYR